MKKRIPGWLWPASIVVVFIVLIVLARAKKTGQVVADLGNEHVETVTSTHRAYNSVPPTSGPHVGMIAPWGVHTQSIPNEIQVHNLEDGGVLIQYNSAKVSEEEIQTLERFARDRGARPIITAPYPAMDHKIALTAWTRLLVLDSVDENEIRNFIRAYAGIDHHK